MATEYINPQWRLPNEKTGNNQGYSLDFDGSNKINLGNSIGDIGTSPMSFSFWVNFAATSQIQTVLSNINSANDNGWKIEFSANSTSILFQNRDTGTFIKCPYSLYDVWTNIIIVRNGAANNKIYINGQSQTLSINTENLTNIVSTDDLVIGSQYYNNAYYRYFNGQIDEVAIFDYALPATGSNSVATLYNSGTPFNPMALSSPPQAYYPLGNSAHMGANYLTPNGALQDYVFDFDSDLIKVSQGSGINISGNLTLSAWVYMEDSTWNPVISKSANANNRNYEFAIRPTTRNISFYTNNGSYEQTNTSLAVNLNTWTHIVISCESGVTNGTKFYFNNALDTTTGTHTVTADTADLYLGTTAWNSFANYFNGQISNVQIWNTNLSTSEVETLYNYGSPIQTLANIPQSSNLKAWYKLDASEIYNSSITDWDINNATAEYKNSSFVDGLVGQFTEYIQIGNYDALSGAQAGSWSFWYNTKSAAGRTTKCTWLNGIAEWVQPSGTVLRGNAEFTLNTSNGLQRTSVDGGFGSRIFLDTPIANYTNEWVHVVGTYDGSNLRVYVNGEQKGLVNKDGANVVDFPATGTITTGNIQVGGGSGVVYFLSARYSNLSVWNKTLTLSEVNEIYNSGQPKSLSSHTAVSNLVSWWTLNNFTTGLVDSIGGYNATLAGSDSNVLPGSVSKLNGESTGMSQSNLITSDLLTTSSYSPYALSFDGNDYIDCGATVQQPTTNYSVSYWVKFDSSLVGNVGIVGNFKSGVEPQVGFALALSSGFNFQFWADGTQNANGGLVTGTSVANTSTWYNVVGTYDGSLVKIYVNNVLENSVSYSATPSVTDQNLVIGRWYGNYSDYYTYGSISNVSVWNTAFTASQVREIYNEGRPSNLHNFSGTAPVAWWQLGSNSSFASNWTVLDEIGSNDGTSISMLENAIVDGVGTSDNGVSTGMGLANNILGSSPNGEANSLSVNMTLANIAGGVN